MDSAFTATPDEAAFWAGRTFDDFLFRPQKTESQTRRTISVKSLLTADIALDLPIVSSNMDSVTGADMARAMAMHGGIGVVHRGMSIERQASEVAVVKRSQSAVIDSPLCLPMGTSIRQARRFARQHGITGILIETASGSNVLAGLLSNRDTPVHDDAAEDRVVDDFMTPLSRLVTGAPDISTDEAERLMFEHRIERLPLIDGANRIQGLITRRDINLNRKQPGASKDSAGHLRCAAAVGARGDYLERAAALLEAGADLLFVDIAHGHSVIMERAVAGLRGQFGNVPLVCGNIATSAGARFMRDIGADAIKVGVGPGCGCRTRLETAAGVPQLQAIREAYLAVGDKVPIVADGGVKTDKDIFLALICGASTVMLGSALSGTDEAPGHVIQDPATHMKKKLYRGMTSPEAVMEALYDSGSSEERDAALEIPPEGQEIQVPYRGSVSTILQRIRGHLQSSVSYGGETTLAAVREKVLPDPTAFLVPLSAAARIESYER
ncbi:IMP dehydrogenase [Halochromatium glycolicum]|uniref:IMP dehydrogenase n=1 Tax=Halochromatium glycolicum TaxID=85075 RepID=UPI001A92D915